MVILKKKNQHITISKVIFYNRKEKEVTGCIGHYFKVKINLRKKKAKTQINKSPYISDVPGSA